MRKTFEIPFNVFPNTVVYRVTVTDKQEERDWWKRAEAINIASERLMRDMGLNGHKRVIVSKIREV